MGVVVSVVVPSYNHAPFLRAAISGVLNQTFDDFEIIVVDDASVDGSQDVLSEFGGHPKVRVILLDRNVGACEAMNIAIRLASGEFIAVCNSDDVWEHWKLERQVPLLAEHLDVAAVFTDVEWIDEAGDRLDEETQPSFAGVFNVPNRSRFEWIRHLVLNQNCLCHPSVLIRQSAYREVGEYNNYLRQLPDLDMWIRLVQKYEILIIPEKLIRFRIHNSNTSRSNLSNNVRTINEHELILRQFFTNVSSDNFFKAFGWSRSDCAEMRLLEEEKIVFLLEEQSIFAPILYRIAANMLFDRSCSGYVGSFDPLDFHKLNGARTPWLPLSGFDGTESPANDQIFAVPDTIDNKAEGNGSDQLLTAAVLPKDEADGWDGDQGERPEEMVVEVARARIGSVSVLGGGHVRVVDEPVGSVSTKALLQVALSRILHRVGGQRNS